MAGSGTRSSDLSRKTGLRHPDPHVRVGVAVRTVDVKPYLILLPTVLFFTACEREQPSAQTPTTAVQTAETSGLDEAVDAYLQSPTEANEAAADRAFAKLDSEIAELDQRAADTSGDAQREARAKASELKSYRNQQATRMTEARARAGARSVGDAVRDAGEAVGDAVGDAADKVRDAVR